MVVQIIDSPEAMKEFAKWKAQLNRAQQTRLLQAQLSWDGREWSIFSGPDLGFDRAGFGPTIADAVKDYVSVYIRIKEYK